MPCTTDTCELAFANAGEAALPVYLDQHVFDADFGHVRFDGSPQLANALRDLQRVATPQGESVAVDGYKTIRIESA